MSRSNSIHSAVFAASLALAVALPAQQVRQQPLGFVLDSGVSRVRPLLGVPGAAIVGNPLDLGADISWSVASPNQAFLLVISGPTHTAGIWIPGAKSIQPLANIRSGATQIVLSPDGASAAYYYPDTNRVHVVTGLPSAPEFVFDADLSSLMNPLKSLAISDDGALLLASETLVDGNAAPAVVAFNAKGIASRIPTVGPASAIAFLSQTHDVLISAVSETVLIRDAAAQASRTLLPTAANSASSVVVSTDGARAFFARSQAGISIVSLTSSAAPPLLVNCDCELAGISRTASPSVYRLTDSSGAPVSLLDYSSAQPRLLVIPPAAKSVITPDNQ
jgi:hypothetical protein